MEIFFKSVKFKWEQKYFEIIIFYQSVIFNFKIFNDERKIDIYIILIDFLNLICFIIENMFAGTRKFISLDKRLTYSTCYCCKILWSSYKRRMLSWTIYNFFPVAISSRNSKTSAKDWENLDANASRSICMTLRCVWKWLSVT